MNKQLWTKLLTPTHRHIWKTLFSPDSLVLIRSRLQGIARRKIHRDESKFTVAGLHLYSTSLSTSSVSGTPYKGFMKPGERRAAVLIPLCVRCGVPSILFIKRADRMTSHKSQVSFPGGMIDAQDLTDVTTSKREFEEETGISESEVDVLGTYHDSVARSEFKDTIVTPVVAFLKRDITKITVLPNPDEVSYCFTLRLKDMLNPRKRDSFQGMPVFKAHQDIRLHPWGFSAYVLHQFFTEIINPVVESMADSMHDDTVSV